MKTAESAQNFNWSHTMTIFQQWNEHQCDDVTQTQIYLGNLWLKWWHLYTKNPWFG